MKQERQGVADVMVRHSADANGVEKVNPSQTNANVNQSFCSRFVTKLSIKIPN